MYLVARTLDDLRKRYKGNSTRNLEDRWLKVYAFYRQPRPHESLDIYVNLRCKMFQRIDKPKVFQFDVKMQTMRKERYNALRSYIPDMWRR